MSYTKAAELLREIGYSLQANQKTIDVKHHPDRDAQFEHISRRVASVYGAVNWPPRWT